MAIYTLTPSQLKGAGIYNSFEIPGGGVPSFSNINSFEFDGIDDYFIGIGGYTELTSGTAMSVSVWFKSSTYTTLGRLLNIGKHVEIKQNSALYSNTQGTFSYILKGNFGNSFATLGGGTNLGVANLVDGQWHHLCFTWNGATTTAKVYEDGVLKVTNTSANGTLNNSTTDAYSIGAEANGNNPINGLIDETAVWTTELSSTDVATIYNNGEPTDLNNNGLTAPTTWSRIGDLATWNGFAWTMTDVNGGYINRSANMVEANRTTDVPPNPFANTLSTYFDGIDDRVEINRTLGSGYAELSISTWVKYNNNVATSNKYHPIVAKIGPSFGNSFVLRNMRSGASSNGGELYFNVHTPNGSFNAFSGVVPSQNVWYNVVGTYDGSNVKIYIDGVLKGTLSASGNINSNNELMMLGDAGYGGYSSILNGNLDEVSIYSRGLTQSEVTDIFGQGVPSDVSSISDIEAYWRMGDGDTANTITDNVGSNNGTMVNMNASNFVADVPTLPFANTKSILLDGVDDYVSMGDVLDFERTSAFSISAWIKRGSTGVNDTVISKMESSGNFRGYLLFISSTNQIRFILRSQNNSSQRLYVYSNTTITDTNYHNIVITYNGNSATSGFEMYLDGVNISTTLQGSLSQTTLNSAPFNIGARNSDSLFATATIDEVAIFSSELSASDITTIYNGGVPNDISSFSPLSWWRCGDGDTSPTLTDNGSASNDGTMTNFTTFSTDVPT